ncbi:MULTISPECIES: hypothetical protein [unclassified Frankia]|uniref:hypothetical protein n=1 Tax=unclassified Frankia TaxID=2632575 RepID=UPI0027DB20AE|nr:MULTISPECIES: hypothetical protein [unclassified Frankia]
MRRPETPGVVATPWDGQDWALVVASGSDLAELYDQIARLPAGLAFAEAFGDVDLVLVYRPATEPPSSAGLLDLLAAGAVERGGALVGPAGPDGLSAGDRYVTAAERTAFADGQADALAAVRRVLTGVLEVPADHGSVALAS